MPTPEDARARAAATYNAAADSYDDPANAFCDPPAVRQLLAEGGVEQAEVIAEAGVHPIPSPDAWWAAVLGTGYRGTLEQLDAGAREHVRRANLGYIRDSGIRSVEVNVVYAVATKSAV